MSDLVRDLTSILKNGGQRAAYRRVTVSDGTITASETNWHNFNYRTASKLTRNMNDEDVFGEDGKYLTSEQGNQTLIYSLKSAQFDKATIDFLVDYGSQATFFQFMVSWGRGTASKHFEAFFPLVQFSGDFDIDLPGRKFDVTLKILTNETAHTPSNFTGISWVHGSTSDFACAAERRLALAETT